MFDYFFGAVFCNDYLGSDCDDLNFMVSIASGRFYLFVGSMFVFVINLIRFWSLGFFSYSLFIYILFCECICIILIGIFSVLLLGVRVNKVN